MKKVFLLLLIGSAALGVSAQNVSKESISQKRHEISVGVGIFNDVQLASALGDLMAMTVTGGYLVEPGAYHAFSPNVNYRYWFTNRFGLGGSYVFDTNSVKIRKDGSSGSSFDEYTRYYSTIAIEGVLNYVTKSTWQLYGLLGGGLSIASVPKSDVLNTVVFPNFQVTPIGVRIGGSFGGFAEVGYGYKGIINVGISVRF
ncbi:hypothetical protein FACS1894182_05270 [Bacteroidia bacterium]|nr:hypothetical protein FACS1894182_05270 [Bacteroidia bacterium]